MSIFERRRFGNHYVPLEPSSARRPESIQNWSPDRQLLGRQVWNGARYTTCKFYHLRSCAAAIRHLANPFLILEKWKDWSFRAKCGFQPGHFDRRLRQRPQEPRDDPGGGQIH